MRNKGYNPAIKVATKTMTKNGYVGQITSVKFQKRHGEIIGLYDIEYQKPSGKTSKRKNVDELRAFVSVKRYLDKNKKFAGDEE